MSTENVPEILPPESENLPVPTEEDGLTNETREELNEVKTNFKDLIEQGKEGLQLAVNVMEGSEHPRAIEVFTGLLRAVAEINKNLIEVQRSKKELSNALPVETTSPDTPQVAQQNNIFVGSTEELRQLLGKM